MALVNVNHILVLDNPTNFANPFRFEITFECLQELEDDLEWRVLYVGKAAADSTQDLVLDEVLVGPVPVGINKFVLAADAPDPSRLEELLGVTVVLVTCSYRDREFVRVGYYVNNEYDECETVRNSENNDNDGENNDYQTAAAAPPPANLDISKVTRQLLADKPRVTKFSIPWGDENEKPMSDNLVPASHKEGSGEPEPEPEDMEAEDEEEDDEEDDEEEEGDEEKEVDLTANE